MPAVGFVEEGVGPTSPSAPLCDAKMLGLWVSSSPSLLPVWSSPLLRCPLFAVRAMFIPVPPGLLALPPTGPSQTQWALFLSASLEGTVHPRGAGSSELQWPLGVPAKSNLHCVGSSSGAVHHVLLERRTWQGWGAGGG